MLTTLRHAVADHTAQPPFLLITRETIQFNPAGDCSAEGAAAVDVMDRLQALLDNSLLVVSAIGR